MYDALREIGLSARLAERRRPEERFGNGGSLGLIDTAKGPIRWVNVLWEGGGGGEYDPGPSYYVEYGVPDPRDLREVQVWSVRIRTFPVGGLATGVRWKGDDHGLRILDSLNADASTEAGLIESKRDVRVRARPKHRCWTIEDDHSTAPSVVQWNCYQAIAWHLLADWPSNDPLG
ncbi:MAG: hypothetical protein ACREXY_20085 [Gammaproteobacteria bacterium]